VGFSAAPGTATANLTAEVANPFRAVVLTSLDDQPIARSAKLLMVAGARAVNTGMQWNVEHTGLTQWGTTPTLIEPVTGRIVLSGLANAKSVTAQPLDGAGRALGAPLRAAQSGDGWAIPVGAPATTWYSVTVER
jgi:hypothetical protein